MIPVAVDTMGWDQSDCLDKNIIGFLPLSLEYGTLWEAVGSHIMEHSYTESVQAPGSNLNWEIFTVILF